MAYFVKKNSDPLPVDPLLCPIPITKVLIWIPV
jgi:hypothetical protein